MIKTTPKALRSSSRWAATASAALARHPVCPDPFGLHPDRVLHAVEVHHCVPIRDAPDLAHDPANLLPLCRACHERAEEMAGCRIFLIPNDIGGGGGQNPFSANTILTDKWIKKSAHGIFYQSGSVSTSISFTIGGVTTTFAQISRARDCIPHGDKFWCARARVLKARKCPVCVC